VNAFAIDTNVAVYAFSEDDRSTKSLDLLDAGPRISVQLLNEFAFVSLRKRQVPWPEIEQSLAAITSLASSLRPVGEDVHKRAVRLAQRYRLRFYDALLLAAAILDGCSIFYSEDMQDALVIEGTLTIVNPFLPAAPA
jgi:predicted nucleic acid-binding protein